MLDFFQIFSLPRTLTVDREALEAKFHSLQRFHHPDRHVTSTADVREDVLDRSSSINQAYRTLRDPLQRMKHLLALYGYTVESSKKVPQSLLMQVMETQERIAELEFAQDPVAKEKIRHELSSIAKQFEGRLSQLEKERVSLSSQWDATITSLDMREDLPKEMQDTLATLSQNLAERAYIETLRSSILAAQRGESLILRH